MGDQVPVDLNSYNMSGILRKVLGHGSDSRSDLKNAVILCDPGCGDDLLQYMDIDQKVLTELF